MADDSDDDVQVMFEVDAPPPLPQAAGPTCDCGEQLERCRLCQDLFCDVCLPTWGADHALMTCEPCRRVADGMPPLASDSESEDETGDSDENLGDASNDSTQDAGNDCDRACSGIDDDSCVDSDGDAHRQASSQETATHVEQCVQLARMASEASSREGHAGTDDSIEPADGDQSSTSATSSCGTASPHLKLKRDDATSTSDGSPASSTTPRRQHRTTFKRHRAHPVIASSSSDEDGAPSAQLAQTTTPPTTANASTTCCFRAMLQGASLTNEGTRCLDLNHDLVTCTQCRVSQFHRVCALTVLFSAGETRESAVASLNAMESEHDGPLAVAATFNGVCLTCTRAITPFSDSLPIHVNNSAWSHYDVPEPPATEDVPIALKCAECDASNPHATHRCLQCNMLVCNTAACRVQFDSPTPSEDLDSDSTSICKNCWAVKWKKFTTPNKHMDDTSDDDAQGPAPGNKPQFPPRRPAAPSQPKPGAPTPKHARVSQGTQNASHELPPQSTMPAPLAVGPPFNTLRHDHPALRSRLHLLHPTATHLQLQAMSDRMQRTAAATVARRGRLAAFVAGKTANDEPLLHHDHPALQCDCPAAHAPCNGCEHPSHFSAHGTARDLAVLLRAAGVPTRRRAATRMMPLAERLQHLSNHQQDPTRSTAYWLAVSAHELNESMARRSASNRANAAASSPRKTNAVKANAFRGGSVSSPKKTNAVRANARVARPVVNDVHWPDCMLADGEVAPVPCLDEAQLAGLANAARAKINNLGDLRVCGVCDAHHAVHQMSDVGKTTTTTQALNVRPPESYRHHLTHESTTPQELRLHYTVMHGDTPEPSVLHDDWKTLILSSNIKATTTHDTKLEMHVCANCNHSLQSNRLPKFAIANGLLIGGLRAASVIERLDLSHAEWDLLSDCRTRKKIVCCHATSGSLRAKLCSHVVQLQVANHAFGHAACALSDSKTPDLPATTVYLSSALKPGADLAVAAAASRSVTVDIDKLGTAYRWYRENSKAFFGHPPTPPTADVDANGIVRGAFYIAPNRPMFAFQNLVNALRTAATESVDAANAVFTQSSSDNYHVYAHCVRAGWPCTSPDDLSACVTRVVDGVKDGSCLDDGNPSKTDWATWCAQHTADVFRPPQSEPPTHPTVNFTADIANTYRVPDSGNEAEKSPLDDVASFTKATASGHGRATLLTDTMQPVAPTVEGIAAATDGARYSVVYAHDGHLYESWNPANLVKAFPQLFPYGRGHPTAERKVPISLRAYVKHTLCLSSQAFAESDDWIFQNFDTLNKSEAHRALGASLRANPDGTAQASTITVDQLTAAAEHSNAVSRALRAGHAPPAPPTNNAALRLLNAIRTSNSKLFGTVEHALNNRAKLFAMEHAFGAHAIWTTTSPDDLGDTRLINHVKSSDRHTAISRHPHPVDTTVNPTTPAPVGAGTTDLHAVALANALAVCQNSGTTAWHFDQAMQILIKDLYRCDNDVATDLNSNTVDGIFGKCVAYAGMTEEQKRLSLHQHTCLFVHGLPCTVTSLVATLRDEKTHRAMVDYIGQVETAEHPLNEADVAEALSQNTHACVPQVDTTRIKAVVDLAHSAGLDEFEAVANHLNENHSVHTQTPRCTPPTRRDVILPVPHSYRRLTEPRPNLPHPPNICCTLCNEIHASTHDVYKEWSLRNCGEKTRDHYNEHNQLPESATIDMYAAEHPDTDPDLSKQSRARLMLVLLDKMVHTPGHRTGCFSRKDNAKKETCRFRRPVVDGSNLSSASVRINGKDACSCASSDKCTESDHYVLEALPTDLSHYESIEVVVKRAHGCEFISNHNRLHFAVHRCNTNTRVVCANPGQIFYTTSYATKVPDSRDATARMVTTLQHAIERHKQSDKTAVSKGTSVAFSLFNAFSSTMEIPSTIAALWLLRPNKGINYYSHDFVNVNLRALLKHVAGTPVSTYHHVPGPKHSAAGTRSASSWSNSFAEPDAPPVTNEPLVTPATNDFDPPAASGRFERSTSEFTDYQHRHHDHEYLCFYRFSMKFYRQKSTRTTIMPWQRFKTEHPMSTTHHIATRQVPVVPLLLGKRMPNRDDVDLTDETDPQTQRYCLLALALYEPWSDDATLQQWREHPVESHKKAMTAFNQDDDVNNDQATACSPSTRKDDANEHRSCYRHMLDHHQHYYHAKKIAGTSTERSNLAEKLASASSFPQQTDFDTYDLAQLQESAEGVGMSDVFPTKVTPVVIGDFSKNATTPHALARARKAALTTTPDTALTAIITTCSSNQRTLAPRVKSLVKCTSCRMHFQPGGTATACNDCVRTALPTNSVGNNAPSAAHVLPEHDVGVALSNAVGVQAARRAATILINDVPSFTLPSAAIDHMQQATGQLWSTEQCQTFTFAAAIVIRIFLTSGRDRAAVPLQFRTNPGKSLRRMGLITTDDPATAFLSGQGGSGKSTVIKAILAFAAAWNVADLVQASAYIGTAAVAIGGVTVIKHTQAKKRFKNFNAPVEKQQLHIIDEVSLMGQDDLNRIDRSLRTLKKNPMRPSEGPTSSSSATTANCHQCASARSGADQTAASSVTQTSLTLPTTSPSPTVTPRGML